MDRKIYLDFHASTPIAPEAVEAMRPFLSNHYGNPASLHWAGVPAKEAAERRLTRASIPVIRGASWTTDAPCSGGPNG